MRRDYTRSLLSVLSLNGCAGFVVLVQTVAHLRPVLYMQMVCKELALSQTTNAARSRLVLCTQVVCKEKEYNHDTDITGSLANTALFTGDGRPDHIAGGGLDR